MARTPQLLDHLGRPVQKSVLTRQIAGPSTSGVRSPLTGTPGDGLNPIRLANILREADQGDPLRQLELAEIIEERDPHYLGVLGTRRRSVTGLDITVEDASGDPIDKEAAELVRQWLKRDELAEEMFDILDAIGKGYSGTEIIWDRSMGQWSIARLEWVDPRFFRFDRTTLRRPLLVEEDGTESELEPFKFIWAQIKAKSGIPTRAGLARTCMWPYLFKKFTERDWAIFTQTYGQPLRLGRYPAGSSEEDQDTLMRAVSDIAGDCAAIIPEGMAIEFIQSGNVSASSDLYERRADWLDKQVSKAVLGQTATTDAEVGGLGSGKEHRLVQEDIERADAVALAAVINRDLVRPLVAMNFPGHDRFPRVTIARPEAEDVTAWMGNVETAVSLGLPVAEDDVYSKLGLRRPSAGATILGRPQSASADRPGNGPESAVKHPLNGQVGQTRATTALAAEARPEANSVDLSPAVDRLAQEAAPAIAGMIEQIEAMLAAAGSMEEFREMLLAGFDRIDSAQLEAALGRAMTAAFAGGMAMVEAETDG
jgi:phage gp29-like protein